MGRIMVASRSDLVRRIRSGLLLGSCFLSAAALADGGKEAAPDETSLKQQFRDPPASARPRVWWHWMNGNVTKDGIAKDLAWMKRVGIGGMQNFDANLATPQIVDNRLAYMTTEWKDAFRFAASEAKRLDLELAIASSPGWSETGGPWVKPEDAMKRLVWTETNIEGGRTIRTKIAEPSHRTGPFAGIPPEAPAGLSVAEQSTSTDFYRDIAIYAVRQAVPPLTQPVSVLGSDGKKIEGSALADHDPSTAITLPHGLGGNPATITLSYTAPRTVRSATVFIPGAGPTNISPGLKPRIETSDDGLVWRTISEFAVSDVPSTASFDAVTARHFRLFVPPAAGPDLSVLLSLPKGLDLSALAAMVPPPAPGLRVGEFRLSADPQVAHFEAKAGFSVAKDYYTLDEGSRAGDFSVSSNDVIDITDRMGADGTLKWSAPAGQWRIIRLGYALTGKTNHPATKEATGLEVDKMDAGAVRRYMDHYLGMYRGAVGNDALLAAGLGALLTDSVEVGPSNWTGDMVAQFKHLRGYDPRPWLPVLTGTIIGSRAKSEAFLYDYRRTIGELHASAHYGTIADVARESGLKLYGEALENGRNTLGDDMAMRQYADYPMAAMWYMPREGSSKAAFLADMKGASSVAHLYGQNIAAAESMTSAMVPWATGPSDLRHVIDLEFLQGINRPVVHTSVHQPRDDKFPGLSLGIFGQYFNRHESWAEMARPWVDYMARNSFLLQQGRNVADVAYFYGEEAPLSALYTNGLPADAPQANAWDFVNFDALTNLLRNDGSELVAPSGARYRLLYLGGTSRRMTLPALRRIAQLVEGGATVLGNPPERSPSLADDPAEFSALLSRLWAGSADTQVGRGRVLRGNDVATALQGMGVAPDFQLLGAPADSEVRFVHRKLADGDSYFLVNRKDRPETAELAFGVTGKAPEIWHADTGKIEQAGYRVEGGRTIVPLTFEAGQSLHIVFRTPTTEQSRTVARLAPENIATLQGPWDVRFQQSRGAPASVTLPQLASLSESSDPGIRFFSGIATYRRTLQVPRNWKPGQPLWLNLGKVHDLAEVRINGKLAGAVWHAPYRVDISGTAKPGANALEISVANLWVNRLIGDAQPGATKIGWTATPTYLGTAPLRPSGLIGPVVLEGQRQK